MKSVIFSLALPLAFFALSCRQSTLVGHYTIGSPGFFDRQEFALKKYGLLTGSELFLEADSAFKYITCGNIMQGKWQGKNDSLFLWAKSSRFRIDSLNDKQVATLPKEPFAYKIRRGNIFQILKFQDGSKAIEFFSKSE